MSGVPNEHFSQNWLYDVVNASRVLLRQPMLIFNFPGKKNTRSFTANQQNWPSPRGSKEGKFWRFHCPRTRKGHFSSCSAAKIFPELAQVVSLLAGQITTGEIPSTLIVPTSLFSSTEYNFCYLLHVRSILDLFILSIVVFSHFRPRDGTLWDVRLD